MDEKQLLKDCLDGNRQAQKRLYDQFAGKMFALCMRYARNQQMAEDFLQEGFIRVFSKLDTFRGQGSFEGWIRTIMVNTSLELLRKNDLLKKSLSISEAFELPDQLELPADRLNEQYLLSCIQSLPAGFRAVFNLYAIEGYTHKEIGELLSISEGTSKSQYARAKAWLQQRISN
ncbi:MAG: RNA polymerase sigma factor [Bacteroidetes bacterium]|nr:RNA polymerase sigma factor [Bacteroidales bacterium]MBU1010059.1 RNA polymerase sigma factor [Bacteroidota bacterium]